MKATEKNGKKFRNMVGLLQKTGQGVRFATDTGYKTGYFMAKHPGVEYAKNQIQKNYKAGLIAILGLGISLFSLIQIMSRLKK